MKWILVAVLFATALHAEPRVKQATGTILRTKGKIQTGSSSRIELELPYLAIVRVGSNADLQVTPDGRSLKLDSGTLLFSASKDAGAFTIEAGPVVAALTKGGGLEMANLNGQGKVIVLEGKVSAVLTAKPNAKKTLRPGQMINVPAGATKMPPHSTIKLSKLIKSSALFNMGDFPGKAKIERNAAKQTPPVPFVTGGFNPDWGGGQAALLSSIGPAGTVAAVTQIESSIQSQRAAQEAALAAQQLAQRQRAIERAEAQQAAAARQAEFARQAAEDARRVAQQQEAAKIRNQGNAFGPGGNQGGGNQGQGNQGQGNNGQGNQGGGNQGQGQGPGGGGPPGQQP